MTVTVKRGLAVTLAAIAAVLALSFIVLGMLTFQQKRTHDSEVNQWESAQMIKYTEIFGEEMYPAEFSVDVNEPSGFPNVLTDKERLLPVVENLVSRGYELKVIEKIPTVADEANMDVKPRKATPKECVQVLKTAESTGVLANCTFSKNRDVKVVISNNGGRYTIL